MENQPEVEKLLAMERVAVVGASQDPSRPGNFVPAYLQLHGRTLLPVNPKYQRVLDVTCYASLAEVPGPIDLVVVFRRPEACADVARAAVEAGAAGVWLQSGIVNEEARQIATATGLLFVQDRCMMQELERIREA
ncbi:MAG: CoA-binding protein [Phycisphaerae bacterium]